MINFLQILTELVSGSQVFFVKIVRRGAAADIQPAHDLPAEIVGHEVKRSVRAGGSLLILISIAVRKTAFFLPISASLLA